MSEQDSPNPSPDVTAEEESRVQRIEEFCAAMVGRMRLDLQVRSSAEDVGVRVNIRGPDRPMLLSNAAALLNSIEYIVNKVFRPAPDDETPAIILDSDNYRQMRESELVLLAQMASKTVLSQGKPLSLQPMTPKERRIVHLALAAIEGVRSQSKGEGETRSITIYPS